MEKYKEPQIYVVNNSKIANELRNNYIVDEGNLGIVKHVKYGKCENHRYVNLEYDMISNLHEYKVVIIDLQNKNEEKICIKDEDPLGSPYLFKVNYPAKIFNPAPIVMEELSKSMNKNNLRIIFANCNNSEEYEIVKLKRQYDYKYVNGYRADFYSTIDSCVSEKRGKKIVTESYELAKIINKYVLEYRVIFGMPTRWDQNQNKRIADKNYVPLLLNQDKEVISYLGYNEKRGYELLLPVCKDKEKLIDELFKKVLPNIFKDIFPESKDFDWLKADEFQPKQILTCEEKKQKLKEVYEQQLCEIEEEEKQIYEKYRFLSELLTETGDVLVEAVKEYFEWLGYKDVKIIDGDEKTLREDIQIYEGDDLFIVEVKGIGGTSTDAECSQVSKHRRRREKQYRDKNVIPIYIVNHQRYTNPRLRENPPFSEDQIEYAENDERGLLTTWQLYQQYKLIENGIFTKEETRESMKKIGLVTLLPENLCCIGKIEEYFSKPKAGILNIHKTEIKVGDDIWAQKDMLWIKGKICSLQVNNTNIDKIDDGEVGIVLDVELGRGFKVFVKTK